MPPHQRRQSYVTVVVICTVLFLGSVLTVTTLPATHTSSSSSSTSGDNKGSSEDGFNPRVLKPPQQQAVAPHEDMMRRAGSMFGQKAQQASGTLNPPFMFHELHSNSVQRSWARSGLKAPSRHVAFKSVQELAAAVADSLNDHGEAVDSASAGAFGEPMRRLFTVNRRSAEVVVPPAFQDRVKSMFAAYPGGTENLGFIEKQMIVTTYNRMTEEYSLFNEVRRYRPGYQEKLSAEKDAEVNAQILKSAGAATCDFCSVERTAEDVFGRIYGDHCYTAANVAKYERWHSLLVSREHHPLNITGAMMVDYLNTAHGWCTEVHKRDVTARFPHIMFDAGARASASQPHQHLQMSMTANRYYTRAEHTRLAAVDYFEGHYAAGPGGEPAREGHSYWADLVHAHEGVGLALRFNRSAVLAYVTPIKERELVVLTEDSRSPCFGSMIAAAINALTDGVGTRAFSMAVTLEPYGTPVTRRGRRAANVPYPALARIVDRGSPLDMRSDVGAMEFYGANNIGADPYHIMPHLESRVNALWEQFEGGATARPIPMRRPAEPKWLGRQSK